MLVEIGLSPPSLTSSNGLLDPPKQKRPTGLTSGRNRFVFPLRQRTLQLQTTLPFLRPARSSHSDRFCRLRHTIALSISKIPIAAHRDKLKPAFPSKSARHRSPRRLQRGRWSPGWQPVKGVTKSRRCSEKSWTAYPL